MLKTHEIRNALIRKNTLLKRRKKRKKNEIYCPILLQSEPGDHFASCTQQMDERTVITFHDS